MYVLYDKNKDVINIGENENLQNQFAKYVVTNFENDACKQKPILIKEGLSNIQKNEKVSF